MKDKDAYIAQLENTIKALQAQVDNLTELIKVLQKERFGSSSEKTPKEELSGQFCIFNEAEAEACDNGKEPAKFTVLGYVRKNHNTKREQLVKDLPVKEVLCDLLEREKVCETCHGELKSIGKETVREELEYIPAKLQIIRYVRLSYECPKCKHTDNPYIVKALAPTSLMSHSLASPSSVAHVMYQKYVNGMPLYRQEKDWEQLGLLLSRATMANWVIRCSQDYIFPIIKHFQEELLRRDIVHCDETPVQVLKEEGKKPQTKSYMWLFSTGNDGKPTIILYDYRPSRSGDHVSDYLKGFTGYVHSDGYSGYNKLSDVTRCGCWAHLRRKFVDAIPQKKAEGAPQTKSEMGRDYCNKLFKIEESLKELSPDERYLKRLALEKPVLEAFWSWLDTVNALNGSALSKAITYARNQKPLMENYLLDGRLSISNNVAENAIRPFTVGRKNWLFSDTPKGADASAAVYSIVETAKANNLKVRAYLEHLLQYMPSTDWRNHPELLDSLMPWSHEIQEACGL